MPENHQVLLKKRKEQHQNLNKKSDKSIPLTRSKNNLLETSLMSIKSPDRSNTERICSQSDSKRVYRLNESQEKLALCLTRPKTREELESEEKMAKIKQLRDRVISRNEIIQTNYMLSDYDEEEEARKARDEKLRILNERYLFKQQEAKKKKEEEAEEERIKRKKDQDLNNKIDITYLNDIIKLNEIIKEKLRQNETTQNKMSTFYSVNRTPTILSQIEKRPINITNKSDDEENYNDDEDNDENETIVYSNKNPTNWYDDDENERQEIIFYNQGFKSIRKSIKKYRF
jgi:hypothetical protein